MNRLVIIILLLSSCSVKRSVISETTDKTETVTESENRQSNEAISSLNTVDLSKYAINSSTIRTIEKLDTLGKVVERIKEEQTTTIDQANNITAVKEVTARSSGLEIKNEAIKKDVQTFENSKTKTKFAPVNLFLIVLVSILLFVVYVKTRSK
jgi:PBP1b-binding outer membrane lipoprotein LpoB